MTKKIIGWILLILLFISLAFGLACVVHYGGGESWNFSFFVVFISFFIAFTLWGFINLIVWLIV